MQTENIIFLEGNTFSQYCERISKSFCPYLFEAEKQRVLFKTTISFDENISLYEIQENLFYNSLSLVEELRRYRLHNPNKYGLLYCNNIVFELPTSLEHISANKVVDWPHWILKCLYSKVGIMVGKFWVGEKLISRGNFDIPSPPLNFISIRSAIKIKDPYFLSNINFVLQDMLSSNDNGENVHEQFGLSFNNIEDREYLKQTSYYKKLKEWSKGKIPI